MFTAGAAVLGCSAEGSDSGGESFGQGLFYCLQVQLWVNTVNMSPYFGTANMIFVYRGIPRLQN